MGFEKSRSKANKPRWGPESISGLAVGCRAMLSFAILGIKWITGKRQEWEVAPISAGKGFKATFKTSRAVQGPLQARIFPALSMVNPT